MIATLAAAALLHASPAAPAPQDSAVLKSGVPTVLTVDPEDGFALAMIRVPSDVTGLRVQTAKSGYDVELYASYDSAPDPYGYDWDIAAEHSWYEESLFIEYSDSVSLTSGRWHFAVAPAGTDYPTEPFTTELTVELVRPKEYEAQLGEVVEMELNRAHGLRSIVEIELPEDLRKDETRELLVEVDCPLADIDVTVGRSGTRYHLHNPAASSYSYLGYERVRVDPSELRGEVVVNVVAYQENEVVDRLPVRVLVQIVEREDEKLPALDIAPEPLLPPTGDFAVADPFSEIARATVAVFGPTGSGSGTVVTESGYILTCAHILVGDRLSPDLAPVVVGFTHDPRVPPQPSFGAEIVEFRQDLDLALLKINGDLLGRPLPKKVADALPFAKPAEAPAHLGASVFGFGFPQTGGSASMVTLTMRRGIVSGFAREVEGVLLKTDAEIHSGDSGGPLVDAAGRIVGVAIAGLADESKGGGIGFVVPLDLVPEDWRKKLGW